MKLIRIRLAMLAICALLYVGAQHLISQQERTQSQPITPSAEYVFAFDLHGVVFKNDWCGIWLEFKKTPFPLHSLLTFFNPFFLYDFFSLFFHSDSWEEIVQKIIKQYPALTSYWPTLLIALNRQIVIPETLTIINNLKAQGYTLYVFSNIGKQSFEQLRAFHRDVFEPFSGFVYTQPEDGWIQKPQKAAYEKFLQKCNKQPEQVILIDDKQINIDAAKEMGFHTILFTSPEQLQKDLIPYTTRMEHGLTAQQAAH